MPKFASICLVAGLITAGAVSAEEPPVSNDPYAWLEDVTGAKPLDWVKTQNAKTEARLASTQAFKQMETSIREVLDSDAKIPGVQKIGAFYYNFWKDKQHERGLCGGAPRWTSTARPRPSGKRCWTWMCSTRPKAKTGCGTVPTACARTTSAA
ncbi:exported hypothetical protein [Xanthomonas citri pv. citri]|uniref:Peptidase S9A N-terminal domain-containing protein n=1 Tax=Xanthomonas citri pv. citri TaxID=611301 RepID=A0A0U5FA01_XANCI|nr:exported hypothetical protein [Xanthomonas citri pv. citri]CEH54187.1 exported hypothetical protein [Xanthomonas citri pv. citri]CEH84049.1 exported hypothetical protein [Xanthomonas citri pv. citri]CEJ21969.1 exported hypothetical protein [Xanthomonas citri pv. citri]CEJ26559.1 exported hypothetical protein [Xanthomonas citri pv. citri]